MSGAAGAVELFPGAFDLQPAGIFWQPPQHMSGAAGAVGSFA